MNPIAVAEIVIVSLFLMMPTMPAANPFRDEFEWKFVNYAPIVTLGALLLLDDLVARLGEELVHRARSTRSTRPWSRPSTTELGDAVAQLDRLAVLAGRSWRVAELPGRADQPQPPGHLDRRRAAARHRGPVLAERRGPARHRPRRRAPQHPRGGRGRRRAPEVVDYRPDLRHARDRLPRGQGAGERRLRRPGGAAPARPTPVGGCTPVRGSPVTSTCSQRQATYRADGGGARLPAAGGVRRPRRRVGAGPQGPGGAARGRPSRATTTCWPPTSSTTASGSG